MKEVLNRFRSWATWVSLAGAVWLLLSSFGIADKIGVTSQMWEAVLNFVGIVLSLFGIVNNPTNKEGF